MPTRPVQSFCMQPVLQDASKAVWVPRMDRSKGQENVWGGEVVIQEVNRPVKTL